MNNVKQFKKYYHGMNVKSPLPWPNCCQQHYIFILWKNGVPWKRIIVKKKPIVIYDSRFFEFFWLRCLEFYFNLYKNPLLLVTLHIFKIFKTFKTNCCQQHWLNLKKFMAPLTKNEKKPPLLPTIIICRFERNCGTFRGGGGKNLMLLTTLN